MSRRPFVAGNWKMHKTASEAGPFVRSWPAASRSTSTLPSAFRSPILPPRSPEPPAAR